MENNDFKTWALIEVMGHHKYAGYCQQEVIAGCNMLRDDVPKTKHFDAFTKYLSPQSLYAISPCTEETAIAVAESMNVSPIEIWSVENQVMQKLREKGLLLESAAPEVNEEDILF